MGEGKEVIIHGQHLKFKEGVKQVQRKNAKYGKSWDGESDPDNRNECKTGGWIKGKLSNLTFKTLNYQSKPETERSSHRFSGSFPVHWNKLVAKRRHWTPTHTHGRSPITVCLQYTGKKW